MPINILMPALSPTMEKGNLAKWLKKEGDKVKSGDVIAEIETDKATMEVEAVDEGTIAKIVVPEGTQDVPVNEVIAVLAGEGEDVKAAGAARRAAEVRTESRSQTRAPSPKPRPKPKPKRRSRGGSSGDRSCGAGSRSPSKRQRKPTVRAVHSLRRWPGGWPRKPASSWRASTAPARMAASSPATSRRPNPARA